MRYLLLSIFGLFAAPVGADTVVAAQTIRPQTILSLDHLAVKRGEIAGGVSDPTQLVGLETRVALYAGRPVRISDVGAPAVVERNQIVPLIYEQNGLRISTEGRSLDRAGPGEFVRVMNLTSRATVSGRVGADGRVFVSQ